MRLLCIAAIGFFVLVIGFRLVMGYYAGSQLQKEIDRVVEAGEPISLEDFGTPNVPDEENAVLVYEAAAAELALSKEDAEFVKLLPHETYDLFDVSEKNLTRLGQLIDDYSSVFELVRQARSLSKADWECELQSPAVDVELPALGPVRLLSKFVRAKALYDFKCGHHGEAVESMRDLLAMADVVDQLQSTVAHLVAGATRELVTMLLHRVLPELKIADPSTTGKAPPGTVDRTQLVALMQDLLNEEQAHVGFLQAMYVERMLYLDTVTWLLEGNSDPNKRLTVPAPIRAVVRPIYELDALRMLNAMRPYVDMAQARRWSQETVQRINEASRMTSGHGGDSAFQALTRPLSQILGSPHRRGCSLHFRTISDRRMAAIAIAIRLYTEDHGHPPGDLNELVGQYLARIPDDPFSDGERIRYCPDVEKPLLYCISTNGIDENGKYTFRKFGVVEREVFDQPFFLDGRMPVDEVAWKRWGRSATGADSTETGDKNDNEQSDQGENQADDGRDSQPQEGKEQGNLP
jgi:hypothetical protein